MLIEDATADIHRHCRSETDMPALSHNSLPLSPGRVWKQICTALWAAMWWTDSRELSLAGLYCWKIDKYTSHGWSWTRNLKIVLFVEVSRVIFRFGICQMVWESPLFLLGGKAESTWRCWRKWPGPAWRHTLPTAVLLWINPSSWQPSTISKLYISRKIFYGLVLLKYPCKGIMFVQQHGCPSISYFPDSPLARPLACSTTLGRRSPPVGLMRNERPDHSHLFQVVAWRT